MYGPRSGTSQDRETKTKVPWNNVGESVTRLRQSRSGGGDTDRTQVLYRYFGTSDRGSSNGTSQTNYKEELQFIPQLIGLLTLVPVHQSLPTGLQLHHPGILVVVPCVSQGPDLVTTNRDTVSPQRLRRGVGSSFDTTRNLPRERSQLDFEFEVLKIPSNRK